VCTATFSDISDRTSLARRSNPNAQLLMVTAVLAPGAARRSSSKFLTVRLHRSSRAVLLVSVRRYPPVRDALQRKGVQMRIRRIIIAAVAASSMLAGSTAAAVAATSSSTPNVFYHADGTPNVFYHA
jgi:hypothetical protein